MDTIKPMVVPGVLGWEPLPPQPKRRWPAFVLPVALVLGLLIGSFTIGLPYYAIAPGTARQVNDLIEVPEANRHPPEGKLLLTTVSLRRARPFDALVGWLDSDVDVVEKDVIVPPEVSGQQYRRLNLQLMDDSKQTAIVVALRRLGYPVTETGQGALVVGVRRGLPAEGNLEPGDVITSVDGVATPLSRDAVAAIRQRTAGDVVRLEVTGRGDRGSRVEEIELVANPDGTGPPLLGIELRTHKQDFDMPLDIEIRSGAIGGPSAGLAFALGVLDTLTPGELTGGNDVAITGTINIDGTVGDVGGVAQKTAAVRRSGATLFLVPEGEFNAAQARAGPNLKVVKVKTLDDALKALGANGGDIASLAQPSGQASPG